MMAAGILAAVILILLVFVRKSLPKTKSKLPLSMAVAAKLVTGCLKVRLLVQAHKKNV